MNTWTSMLAYRVKGRIGPDRTLTIQLPPDAPPGEYEIILLYPDPEPSVAATDGSHTGIPEDFDQQLDKKDTQ
jgi:hypothetical protein